jgi:hypothetical protein
MRIDGTRFEGRADGVLAWGVANYGSPMTLQSCVVSNFFNSVYVYAYDDTLANATQVLNCTLVGTNSYGVYFDRASGQVRNSIITSLAGSNGLVQAGGGVIDHSYNLVFGFAAPFVGTSKATGEFHKNPRFVDLVTGNFQLAKGSPAINTGLNLPGVVDYDLLGQPRGSYQVWEIGAYEYMASNGAVRVLKWEEKQ